MHSGPIRASGSQIAYNIVTRNVWDYNIKTKSEEKNSLRFKIYLFTNERLKRSVFTLSKM